MSGGDNRLQLASLPAGEAALTEELTLLLLSDSNLPVGGFVSSSGLESFVNHSFLNHFRTDIARSEALISFVSSNAHNYAALCAPFFYHLSAVVAQVLAGHAASEAEAQIDLQRTSHKAPEEEVGQLVEVVRRLNELYDTMCLSHVSRRNSYAQGAAMLMLYTKSFAPPADATTGTGRLKHRLIDALKCQIRQEKWSIHFPTSFALVTALLELSFDRSIHLHLFLHIRSILSAAVRLNIIGPYLSQGLLFRSAKPMLERILAEMKGKRLSRADQIECGICPGEDGGDDDENGPATNWPFGEIIQTRHDVCHVRLFNS